MNEKKIIFAESDIVDSLPQEIDRILAVLGHPEALLTDLSTVADFMIFLEIDNDEIDQHNMDILSGMEDLLQRKVDTDETLASLAQELHAEQNTTLH